MTVFIQYNRGMRTRVLWRSTRLAYGAGLLALCLFLTGGSVAWVQAEDQGTGLGGSSSSDSLGMGHERVPDAAAEPVQVTPVVANEKAKPRDIIKKELLVTNNTFQRVDLYLTVEDVDPIIGSQQPPSPGIADLSSSLASWIEITRGVIELMPGESRKVPYLIHVNLNAKPGSYFARVQARAGSNRAEAEANPSQDAATLILNVEVLNNAKERLELGNFLAGDSVVLGETQTFSYMLENVGNRDVEPRGAIRIFNRRGEEVGSVPVNLEGETVTSEGKKQLAAVWSAAGRFGKYKAFLDLEYGEGQIASVQDTVYFWVFPWKEVFAAVVGVLVLAVVGTFIVHLRSVAAPVRVRHTEHHRETPQMSESPSKVASRQAPHTPFVQVTQGVPTVLSARSVGSLQNPSVSPPRHVVVHGAQVQRGAVVAVAPRSSTLTVQGGTVTLTSRR